MSQNKAEPHLYQTNQVSVGAPRTPLPCAFGTQYLRTAIVLLLGSPATAMHVSTFFGCTLAPPLSWPAPPQTGLRRKHVFKL